MLLLTAPLLGVVALLIQLETRGPICYRHLCLGRSGKSFGRIRFCTMGRYYDPADTTTERRLTRIGAWIRNYSIDDVPNMDTRVQNWQLWLRWIVANALGELVGLGVVGLVGTGVIVLVGSPVGLVQNLGFAALMVLSGAFEGSVLGLFQFWVLRDRLPRLKQRHWIAATVIGAVVAWSLGIIPSLIGNLGEPTTGDEAIAVSDGAVFLLASLMGASLGLVLALPQWRILRRHVDRAGWWIPANAIAWACGMPVVFWLAGHVAEDVTWRSGVAIALIALATTGAIVGAIHGAALLWLLPHRRL
ncbi:MAG: sugar transferase [Cyanobacteria bacterium J06642_11]